MSDHDSYSDSNSRRLTRLHVVFSVVEGRRRWGELRGSRRKVCWNVKRRHGIAQFHAAQQVAQGIGKGPLDIFLHIFLNVFLSHGHPGN